MRTSPLAAAATLPTSGRAMIDRTDTTLERPVAAVEIAADWWRWRRTSSVPTCRRPRSDGGSEKVPEPGPSPCSATRRRGEAGPPPGPEVRGIAGRSSEGLHPALDPLSGGMIVAATEGESGLRTTATFDPERSTFGTDLQTPRIGP